MKPFALLAVITVAVVTFSPPADAQAPARAPSPAAAARPRAPTTSDADEPQVTTASFGDWIERCQRVRNGTESLRVCEAGQSIQVEGQNGPVAQLAIGRIKKTDPLRLTLILPVNIGFPSAPKISIEGKPAATVELAWRRCMPGGCVADVGISEPVLALWRAETVAGRIEGKTGSAQDFQLAFSFKGLSQALDTLLKEDQ